MKYYEVFTSEEMDDWITHFEFDHIDKEGRELFSIFLDDFAHRIYEAGLAEGMKKKEVLKNRETCSPTSIAWWTPLDESANF